MRTGNETRDVRHGVLYAIHSGVPRIVRPKRQKKPVNVLIQMVSIQGDVKFVKSGGRSSRLPFIHFHKSTSRR